MNDFYCVVDFEDEQSNSIGIQYLLPYAPSFYIGQNIHLAESVDKDSIEDQYWNPELELHKDYKIVSISQSFEHRYTKRMSIHHFIIVILKEETLP